MVSHSSAAVDYSTSASHLVGLWLQPPYPDLGMEADYRLYDRLTYM
jgi:hypothetical protein